MVPSVIPPINNASTSRTLPSFQQESKFASDMRSMKTKQGGAVRTMPSQPRLSSYQIPPPIDSSTSLSTWHTLAPALDQFSNLPSSSSVPPPSLAIDPESDLLPTAIMSWKLAMQKADKSLAHVHSLSVSVETWFLDPCLIVGTTSEDRRKRYLVMWLSIRPAWINCVTSSTASAVHPSNSRGFLNSIPNPEEVFSSSTASSRELNEAMDLFGAELMQLHITAHQSPALLTWHNVTVTADTLNVDHIHQVLWDLAEHNFHFELLSLDKRMASEAWNADSTTREEMVLHVFDGGAGLVLGSEPFPDQNWGLGVLHVEDRSLFVDNFHALLSSWPDAPSTLQNPLGMSPISTHIFSVECCITLFYIQTFYDTYRRPPIIPRHIPASHSDV
ncbi:hypothetical protein AZE42_10806 [Rhizopogon vesiculosus]|uniref:Uncharacterized protein n=1 Tax=Rhizopogon vesiculosus TaxID=180088 RepID=A0A1J8QNW6_9AGAM|nr:hypothetical protein AZE42_10806 [Rhizopogon vesiculosus]